MASTVKEMLADYEIKNIQGLAAKERKIEGVGSYGTVYKITIDGVPRIAKQLHKNLLSSNTSAEGRESILKKFYQECLLLSELDHPNIVDFIGVHSVVGSPILEVSLIMELMDTDLDRFINVKNHPIVPISIKNSILLDVSNGLFYLHSRKPESIVHRDLTTKNILLTKDLRAKIADLGVAKLLTTKAAAHTKCPGTPAYMPPEALRQNPQYGTELDIFSFGQVALCVAIQDFAEVFDVSDCCPVLLADCRKRNQIHILKRKVWIDSIKSPNSCLRELILGCLKDSPGERPTAKEVSNCMKVLSYRFPKTPKDFSMVWDGPRGGILATQSQGDSETIEKLDTTEKLTNLEQRNQELVHEMERVRQELVETKNECEGVIEEERKIKNEQMDKVRHELEKEYVASDILQQQIEEEQLAKGNFKSLFTDLREQVSKTEQEKKELQDKVDTIQNLAELYKQDFEKEREDREKAHSQMEAIKEGCLHTLEDLSRKLVAITLERDQYKRQLEGDEEEPKDKRLTTYGKWFKSKFRKSQHSLTPNDLSPSSEPIARQRKRSASLPPDLQEPQINCHEGHFLSGAVIVNGSPEREVESSIKSQSLINDDHTTDHTQITEPEHSPMFPTLMCDQCWQQFEDSEKDQYLAHVRECETSN